MGDTDPKRPLAGLVKLVLNLRLVALFLTVLWLPTSDPRQLTVVTMLLAACGLTSLAPILAWDRVGPFVLAHPTSMLPDLGLAALILGAVGLDTPFGLFVISTALVAGVLYGRVGAAVMSVALVASYVGGALLGNGVPTTAEILGTPVLVPLAALGGAAVRELLVRQQAANATLAEEALNGAASTERTRLAREMHDTLAKTLHGIALSATALPRLLDHDRALAVSTAEQLAATAERAASEARSLIVDLRQDDLERPLGEALEQVCASWSARTGVAVTVRAEPCEGLSPSARYELFCIAREALRNAREHGEASHVDVALQDGDEVVLTITDDGRGFDVPADLTDLADDGHFGVIGMRERAATVGGEVRVRSRRGRGATVEVTTPRVAAGEREGQRRPNLGATVEGTP